MRKLVAAGVLTLGFALSALGTAQAQGRGGQRPEAAVVGGEIEARAIVETIDRSTRTVLLRNEDGSLATIKVAPDVRNLAQVKPGDRVVLRMRLGVVAEMAPPSGAGGPGSATEMAGRAAPGERPAAFAGEALRTRVTFNSYDPASRAVTLTMPDGKQGSMVLQTKAMQDFAATLKAGDKVDVTILRSVAIAVLPMK